MSHHLETRLAHAGCTPDPATGAVVLPPYLTSTFERAPDGSFPHGFVYSRAENPTRQHLEHTLADLDGGAAAFAFSSGMAGAMAVLQTLRPGDHVVLADDGYFAVRKLIDETFTAWGLTYDRVDLTDVTALEAACRAETQLVWAETPSNPMLKITNLEAVAEVTHAHGAQLVVDSTWATPLLVQPLALGADIVVHSLTKYMAGHSDLIGGGVVVKHAEHPRTERLSQVQRVGGAVMDPFSAWLTLRGLRSLGARMRIHCANARALAAFLDAHPRVERVNYPGLSHHPGHATAAAQMADFGGMLSFLVKGGEAAAMAVAARVQVFRRATSLGGTESLIEHRASIEAPPTATPTNLLRISVGLEHTADLIADLSQALGAD
ncbi:MAG: aminotransferase class I/II-fold pyridoxal phosphate-dependent enzyme [Bacteroidota bacterium]